MKSVKTSAKMRRFSKEKLIVLISALVLFLTLGASTAGEKRGKVIDFEDDLVEGVNKRPLDSFNQISERDRNGRHTHLYRKRQGFRNETQETLREVRVWQ